MKCDENRPSCDNCTKADCRCPYLDLFYPRNATPSGGTASRLDREAILPSPAPSATLVAAVSPAACHQGPPEDMVKTTGDGGEGTDGPGAYSSGFLPPGSYSIGHLSLLHHLENEVPKSPGSWRMSDLGSMALCYEDIFKSAMVEPYLMDQMLALSALHMSTLASDSAEKARYIRDASTLQTRALGLFNSTKPQVTQENALALLTFSSFVGLHCLFEAATSREDFSDFLGKVVKHLKLHQGVGTIAHQGWQFLRQTGLNQIINTIETGDKAQLRGTDRMHECDHVESLLKKSRDTIGVGAYEACHQALSFLRWIFDARGDMPEPYPTHLTMAWPVRIAPGFIELLEQRQPVSLIILAHWAILLHADREFWVFGDAGRYMIESLCNYLGPYWEDWLSVPRRALNSA